MGGHVPPILFLHLEVRGKGEVVNMNYHKYTINFS